MGQAVAALLQGWCVWPYTHHSYIQHCPRAPSPEIKPVLLLPHHAHVLYIRPPILLSNRVTVPLQPWVIQDARGRLRSDSLEAEPETELLV